MKFQKVCIESLGYTLPSENWSSADVEQKLSPLYQRLKLPEGRLELMTGIAQRGFWPPDVRPSQVSVRSGTAALEAAEIDPQMIGCLIHGSVCRDFLEPVGFASKLLDLRCFQRLLRDPVWNDSSCLHDRVRSD